jgi:protein-tyrosine-phosphatase
MANPTTQPPDVLRMLAHPLRWQLVTTLSITDQRVQELVERLRQPYNLVSYHLKLLRDMDLVSQRQSDADRRDLYYHLNLEKLQEDYQAAGLIIYPGWIWNEGSIMPADHEPLRVIFLCTYNSVRSQMAEGLLRHLGGNKYIVTSAGSQPRPIHPDAVSVMGKLGIDISQQRAKHLDEVKGRGFDIAITVCDRVREECKIYDFCESNLHWSIPDPAGIPEPDKRQQVFMSTAQELEHRIKRFMAYVNSQRVSI